MDTPTLNLPLPGLIDGDTDQVEELTIEALYDSMDQFAEWIDDAARQLANSERSRILKDSPSISADELSLRYFESDRAGSLVRLKGAAKALVAAVAEMRA